MILFSYDKNYISKRASELNFVRDTLEKAYRLADILEYLNTNPLLKVSLALKGGTAINLTIFNLPRLSVDIDLDFLKPVGKEEMLQQREMINNDILKYMESSGYSLNPRSKTTYSLDSKIFDYINLGGNKDNIKIEINYSMRNHVLVPQEAPIIAEPFKDKYLINCLNPIEIFAGKINALLTRTAARDLYDVYNMVKFEIFNEGECTLLRKCIVFYKAISTRNIDTSFDISTIDKLTQHKIRTDLQPVIRNRENFDLAKAKITTKKFIKNLMKLTANEQLFLTQFANKDYKPELLFDDHAILERVKKHPMALWKIQQK